MKKILSLLIVLSMVLVMLVSCGGGKGGDGSDTGSTTTDTGSASTDTGSTTTDTKDTETDTDTDTGNISEGEVPETNENVSTDNIVEF